MPHLTTFIAFGIFAKLLDGVPGFEHVAQGAEGLELADSITGDAHKLLNVPYDCGFFFCRHPDLAQEVFQNPNAAYLDTKTAATDIIRSPLNIGIENSRRFRGLPVYATLVAYGRDGYRDMLQRQIRFARAVAAYLYDHDAFELLPKVVFTSRDRIDQDIFIIVLFKAKDDGLNEQLVQRINTSSKMYVSGTVWDGSPASRIAVANWQVEPHRDLEIVKGVVEKVVETWAKEK
jgi:glutamate/tyrosine decarboxylase-like PLP-dependent enzyme